MNRLLFVFIFFGTALHGQNVLNSDNFFNSRLGRQTDATFYSESARMPWIEDIDFRTETDDFDFARQEYTLRISPSSPGVRKAQKELLETYKAEPNNELTAIKKDEVLRMYKDWVNLFLLENEAEIIREFSGIIDDRKIIYEKKISISEFDPEEILKNEVSLVDVNQKLFELELLKERLIGSVDIDHSDMISINDILDVVESSDIVLDEGELTYERQVLEKEMALEKAEGKKVLDFVQLRYNGPHDDLLRERLAVGVAFRLSNSSSRKIKMERLGMELEQLEQEFSLDSNAQQLETNDVLQELQFNLKLLESFDQLQGDLDQKLELLSEAVKKQVGFDPLVILKLKETKLEARLDRLQIVEDIYINYLKYLSISNRMFQLPFKNYLKA